MGWAPFQTECYETSWSWLLAAVTVHCHWTLTKPIYLDFGHQFMLYQITLCLRFLLKNITDRKMIFKNKKNIWARVWSPCIIHVLICIIHVLMHHKMFEILKTAIAITTHRDKNVSTCQCPVAKKYVFYLLHIFLTFWRLKTMIIYNFHIIK